MSEEDIITNPLPLKGKQKDPRRVKAGLALAAKNKEARAALAREIEREQREKIIKSIESHDQEEEPETKTEIPWQYLLAIGSVAIAATSLYLQWKRPTVIVTSPKLEESVEKKQHSPPMI